MPKKYIVGKNLVYDEDYWGKFIFSKNKTKILFSIDKGIESSEEERHEFYVLDKDFNLLWKKEYKKAIADELFSVNNIKITEEGNILFLAKKYNEVVKEKRKGVVNYRFELHQVSKENQKVTQFQESGFFVNNIILKVFSNEIVCTGFCSETKKYGIEGLVFAKFDKSSLNLVSETYQPFISDLYKDKYGEEAETEVVEEEEEFTRELSNYTINSVVKMSDEGYFITAEEFIVNTGAYNSVSYAFEDIMVLSINSKGNLNWSRNINKKQLVGGGIGSDLKYMQDKGISYSVVKSKDNIHLILNAHKDLRKLLDGRIEFKSGNLGGLSKKNSKLYDIMFTKDKGESIINVIQNNKESELMFNVMDAKLTKDEANLILYGSKDKKTQFLTIDLK